MLYYNILCCIIFCYQEVGECGGGGRNQPSSVLYVDFDYTRVCVHERACVPACVGAWACARGCLRAYARAAARTRV